MGFEYHPVGVYEVRVSGLRDCIVERRATTVFANTPSTHFQAFVKFLKLTAIMSVKSGKRNNNFQICNYFLSNIDLRTLFLGRINPLLNL